MYGRPLGDTPATPAWSALQATLATNPPIDAGLVGPVTAANREAATLYAAAAATGDTATELTMETRERRLAYLLAAIQGNGDTADLAEIIAQIEADSGGPLGLGDLFGKLRPLLIGAAVLAGAVLVGPPVLHALARSGGSKSA